MRTMALLLTMLLAASVLIASDEENEERFPDDVRHVASRWYQMVEAEHGNVFDVMQAMREDSTLHTSHRCRQRRKAEHWIAQRRPHADASGRIGPLQPSLAEIDAERTHRSKIAESSQAEQPRWEGIGPFGWDSSAVLATGSQGIGVVRTHLVLPDDRRVILAGTVSAGMWRSSDAGRTWTGIAQDEPITWVSRFAVSGQHIYAATTAGLYVSVDRGLTFKRLTLSGDVALSQAIAVDLCIVDPNDHRRIVISAINRLFLSTDAGASWKSASNMIGTWWDLAWHPTRSDVAYGLVQVGGHISFARSTSSGVKFNPTGQGYPAARDDAQMLRALIGVTPADPRMVAVMIGGKTVSDVGGVYGLYVSTDEGSTFEHRCCGSNDGPEPPNKDTNPNLFDYDIMGQGLGQITWDMGFSISTRDPQFMVAAGIFPYRSSDGGRTWRSLPAMHYDIQSCSIIGDSVWLTHDGGMTLSADRGATISDRSKGISATELWGFGQSHDGQVMTIGAYHLPTFIRDTTVYASARPIDGWYPWAGADAMGANVNPIATEWIYAKPWSNVRALRTRSKLLPPSSSDLGIDLGYITLNNIGFDPVDYFHIVAPDYAKQRLVSSRDNAMSWTTLKQFTRWVHRVRQHPRKGASIMVLGDDALWLSNDRGSTWTNATPSASVGKGQGMVDMAFDADDPRHIYLAYGGNQTSVKVVESIDAGATWTSISTGLPSFAIFTLISRTGAPGELYVGTSYGVYRRTSDGLWESFGKGLPLSDVNFLDIDQPHGLIRAATNRGLWQAPLPASSTPRAQISRSTDTVRCSRTPVRFGCRSSALETSRFRRTWHFPGGSPSTSSASVVDVFYQAPGSYDAELIVENEYGRDSVRLTGAVTMVRSECDGFDPVAGNAADLTQPGDHITLGRFPRKVRAFTFTAWVKPVGMQPNFSAILCTDADPSVAQEVGLQFVNDNNELGYLWTNGRWWWGSGLTVRPDQWSHVALTIDSTGAMVYVNGIPSKDYVNLPPADLSSLVFKLGTYHYWSSRNFKGLVDEVAIYSRCLSTEEIRSGMHLTKRGPEDGLLAYYQFNESVAGEIYDKLGAGSGRHEAGAGVAVSEAPVAAGRSQLNRVNPGVRLAAFEELSDSIVFYQPLTDSVDVVMTRFDRNDGGRLPQDRNVLEGSWRNVDVFSPAAGAEVSFISASADSRYAPTDAASRMYGLITRSGWEYAQAWSSARIRDNGSIPLQGLSVSAAADRGLLTPLQLAVTYSGPAVGVQETVHVGSKLRAIPQPAADVLAVTSPGLIRQVAIYDLSGQTMFQATFPGTMTEQGIDVSSLRSGTYVLTVDGLRHLVIIHR